MLAKNLFALWVGSIAALAADARAGQFDQPYDEDGYGVSTLEERVAKLERRLSGNTLSEMANRIERLQAEVGRLKGEVEESNNALERLRKQQREMTADFDSRLLKLSPPAVPIAGADPTASTPVTLTAGDGSATAPPSGTAVPPVAAIPPPAAPSPPPVVIDPAVRRADYEKAFNTLKEGKYTEAIRDFKNFVMAYPAGEYTDNAYYWLAEAYYVNRDFPSARENFRKVTETFPQSGKLADAYLKLGFIEYENGQYAASKDLLNEVIRRFPEASAAKMAEKRLERMRQEKR